MCKSRILCIALIVVLQQTLAERCTTPIGKISECIPLTSCPSLLWSFANPRRENEEHLRKFICEDDESQGFIVCCPAPSDGLVFENDPVEAVVQNGTRLYNLRQCGMQRPNGFSKEGPIPVEEFPWLVAIMTKSEDEAGNKGEVVKTACTGTLINARYVLTGARCYFENIEFNATYFVRIEEFYVRNTTECVDWLPYQKKNCSNYWDYDVEEQIIHPFYNSRTHLNDIALLRLAKIAEFNDDLRPICLPLPGTRTATPGNSLYVSGWSQTPMQNVWSLKSKALTKVISKKDCEQKLAREHDHDPTTMYDMCTSAATKPTCSNNIGNPIMFQNNNRWHIEAIASRGGNCSDGTPSVNTNVKNYLQWIQENIKYERCTTPHNEEGECIPLTDCPTLLDAFSNPTDTMVKYLSGFICSSDKNIQKFKFFNPIVCCGTKSNFTVLKTRPSINFQETVAKVGLDNKQFCGYQHRDDYLSNDNSIAIDEFPWVAAIYLTAIDKDPDVEVTCGGTLISNRYVISSALCFSLIEKDEPIVVRLGEFYMGNVTDCVNIPRLDISDCSVVQEYRVEEVIRHPFANEFAYLNDVLLFRLAKKVIYSDYIRPICLPFSTILKPSDTLYTTGWGETTTSYDLSKIKKKIASALVPNEKCLQTTQYIYRTLSVTPYQFCSRDFRNSTEFSCAGDRGGPVMVASQRNQWFLEGIASSLVCDDNEPQVHVKVSKYLEWIITHMRP